MPPHSDDPPGALHRSDEISVVASPDALLTQEAMEEREAPLQRRVFDLAWPVIGENFLQTMLGIVDTLLVAQLGAAAIAGVGASLQIMFFVISALSAMSVGSSVLVAQSYGARNLPEARLFAKQSLTWSVILSAPMIVAGIIWSDAIIAVFGMEPEVNVIGAEYLQVTMGTVVVLTLLILGGGVLRGVGDSRTPMLVTAVINVLNIFLTYALIFGAWGLPALGAVGSAWATFICRAIGVVLLGVVLWRGRKGLTIRGTKNWAPDLGLARRLFAIGLPAAAEQLATTAAFLMLTVVVAKLGTLALAAHRIAFNALSLSFLPGIGFAIAATALVGQSVGARRPDEGAAVTRIATLWALVWMGSLGVILFFFGTPIMRVFSQDPEVVEIGTRGLRTVALAQPIWAILFVHAGALRGVGNTRYPLWVNTVSIWSAVGITALLLNTVGGGLVAVWGSFLLMAPVSAALLWWRFRREIRTGAAWKE